MFIELRDLYMLYANAEPLRGYDQSLGYRAIAQYNGCTLAVKGGSRIGEIEFGTFITGRNSRSFGDGKTILHNIYFDMDSYALARSHRHTRSLQRRSWPMPKELKLNLPPADDLFSTQAERDDRKREKVLDIPLSEIDPFPDHPFQVRMDESMQAMADSIKTVGVQTPAVLRPKEDGRYELVSGHRRKMASEIAGLGTLPCIAREMNRDEAIIAMVDANLQREVILPSEKAKSYQMKLDAIKRQGPRADLTCYPSDNKLIGKKSLAVIGEPSGDSQATVHRYIRLTNLVPQALELVDTGKIAMRPAVELSDLPQEQQEIIMQTIASEECTPSHVQAMKMRKFGEQI